MRKTTLLCATAALLLLGCGEKKEDVQTKPAQEVTTETMTYKKSGKQVIKVSGEAALEEYIKSPELTVVDMYADWCGPCRRLAPVLLELANDYGDKASFLKVDIDKDRGLARKYRAQSIPLVLFFKNGEVVDRMEGFGGRPPLEEKIKKNM